MSVKSIWSKILFNFSVSLFTFFPDHLSVGKSSTLVLGLICAFRSNYISCMRLGTLVSVVCIFCMTIYSWWIVPLIRIKKDPPNIFQLACFGVCFVSQHLSEPWKPAIYFVTQVCGVFRNKVLLSTEVVPDFLVPRVSSMKQYARMNGPWKQKCGNSRKN